MPYSSEKGKDFIKAWATPEKRLGFIVDVGPGAGTYYDVLQPVLQAEWWTAVEIWAPYVEQFRLTQKYNEVIIADALWMDWDKLGLIDLAILGDVLEHMKYEEAATVLDALVTRSRYVIISLPIIHYPQGTEMGNPYEAHVQHYEVVGKYEGQVVGVYIIRGEAP